MSDKKLWEEKFLEKVKKCHKKNLKKVVKKIMIRISTAKNSLVSRSKKKKIPCTVTIEDLRELVYDSYGQKCRYCPKILTIQTFVFDHIIPVSKSGPSSKENLQLICRTCNNIKGSLDDSGLKILLDWLETIPPDLKKNIRTRLAGGIH